MRLDILVIGISRDTALATAKALASRGLRAEAVQATSPTTGQASWVAAITEARPRVVLLDVSADANLPVSTIAGFLREMTGTTPSTPDAVVVRGGAYGESGIAELFAAGASDIVDTSTPVQLLAQRLRTQLLVVHQREDIDRKQRYQAVVSACARALIGGGELPELLAHVLSLLQQATGVSRAYIFRNEEDPELGLLGSQIHECCAPGVTPQIDNPDLQRIPLVTATPNATRELACGRTFTGLVARLEEPEGSFLGAQGILSILILPIFRGSEFWGFIGFDDCVEGIEWKPDDIALLKIVAEATGLAAERARVESEIYRMAVQDSLTGLHNRRYMLDRLEQLASEASRGAVRFTLALVDIDLFKRINDTHGHAAGDAVLRHFASGLQHQFRAHDLVGRHGGEEFLVVMLNADEAQMVSRLEALRMTMLSQPLDHGGCALTVRFSAGVASSRELGDASMVRELLEAADRNLYRAKREGRDRTVAGAPPEELARAP